MDNQRFFLWVSLAFVIFLIYQAWNEDYGPRPQTNATTIEDDVSTTPVLDDVPGADSLSDLPSTPPAQTQTPEVVPAVAEPDTPRITVKTDVLDLEIDLVGGDLRQAKILQYPKSKKRPDDLVLLLDDRPDDGHLIQSGLLSGKDFPGPNHRDTYSATRNSYELSSSTDELKVPLTWQSESGLKVQKIYTFKRGQYAIDLQYIIENDSGESWQGAAYVQLQRINRPPKRSMTDVDSYSFTGPVMFDGESYEKIDVDDLQKAPIELNAVNGWIATIQHHFLVAAVPTVEQSQRYEARQIQGNRYLLRAIGPTFQVASGSTGTASESLFVGPKLQYQLEEVGERLELTVDYGMFTIFSQPLFWLLDKIHSVVKNWGWAIIILTILIKLVFYKLAETSGRSMAKMRKLQPRLKSIQERYKDDREKLSRAMMDLYKTEKVNPAAGCLPILVQMPVFLALYWVLLESVELRQAPWALWINDLSVKDPYFILPVLMGASMFFMQKLNPQPTDPVQAKVMTILPLVMSVFMAFFPAGLVLYWLVNNLLSIAQQWRINKVVAAER
ncbi:MAG: membrane protein insertase YidC [Pseudomonadota bacterium]